MGQAKRKRDAAAATPMVYHHTSTLRTNLLWMSGVIELEGRGQPAFHPHLGEIRTDASLRRAVQDFPAVAWFTTQVATPQCLQRSEFFFIDKDTGKQRRMEMERDMVNLTALNRIALGFPVKDIPVTRWIEHRGYHTAEGRALNESAIDAGDNPADWYVSEEPVDILKSTQVWCARSMLNPKLERWDWYLKDVHNMVLKCRAIPGAYIPPTWLKAEEAHALSAAMGIPSFSGAAQ